MIHRLKLVVVLITTILIFQALAGFSTCRFNFGMSWKGDSYNYPSELDYVTIWAGSDENFNQYWHGAMLKACSPGAKLDGKTPVYYSYIIAFTARRDWGLLDCDVGSPSLCDRGAEYIRTRWYRVTEQYAKYASETAKIYGTSRPIIWLMEPDYYQYSYSSQQGGGLSFSELGQKMSELVGIIKKYLPNAVISMDIAPWISNQSAWYGSFNMSQFSYVNTSGGRTDANSTRIRNENNTTWKGIYDITKKGIIADDGYGVGGGSIGHDATWDDPNNLNARIADGVIAITQADARSDWNSIITNLRPKLNTPLTCSGGGTTPPPPTTSYSLNVSVSGSGTVSKNPNQSTYSSGSSVTLTANPSSGYVFSSWSGDLSGTANPATVTMNSNKNITANFTANNTGGTTEPTTPTEPTSGSEMLSNGSFSSGTTPWYLGVYNGAQASGSVSNGEYVTSISNGGSATWNVQFTQGKLNLENGKTYTLSFKARAATNRTVQVNVGMSGSPYNSYSGSFNVNLTTSTQSFSKTFTMNSSTDANARVEFNSGMSTVRWYLDDVSLVSGSATGTTPPPPTTTQYSLTVSTSGSGTVAKSPNQTSYTSGTEVTLTASPSTGYVFSGWSGSINGSTNPVKVTMDGNKTITANFTQQTTTTTYTLNVSVSGSGTVAKSPNQSSYASGTSVTLTASPAKGYVFSGWSGSISGSANPVSITMDGNKRISATFVQQQNTQPTPTEPTPTEPTPTEPTPTEPSVTNILKNGDFSGGTGYWNLGAYNGANAWAQVVNGQYVVNSSSSGSASWNIQITQTGVKLEKGKTYTLSFDAKAASNRTVEVNVGMSNSPYTSYSGGTSISLTTTMQRFTKTFTMQSSTDYNGRVEVNAGLATPTWYLDNVVLSEASGLPKATPVINDVLKRESVSLKMTPSGLLIKMRDAGRVEISLFDMHGRSVKNIYSGILYDGEHLVSTQGVIPGTYVVSVRDKSSEVLRGRIVITK